MSSDWHFNTASHKICCKQFMLSLRLALKMPHFDGALICYVSDVWLPTNGAAIPSINCLVLLLFLIGKRDRCVWEFIGIWLRSLVVSSIPSHASNFSILDWKKINKTPQSICIGHRVLCRDSDKVVDHASTLFKSILIIIIIIIITITRHTFAIEPKSPLS